MRFQSPLWGDVLYGGQALEIEGEEMWVKGEFGVPFLDQRDARDMTHLFAR
jgi:hypothetical protein